jgi:hypothetical protein
MTTDAATANGRKLTQKEKDRVDELLDDALEHTFPASDPPAMTEPAPPCPQDREDEDR